MPQAIPIILMVASTAVAAYGAIQAGKASSKAAKFNAAVAQQNADISRQQADAAAQEKHRQMVQRLGSMEAAYGASGVTSDSGSVLDVLGDSIRQGTLDQLTAKYNGQVRAAGYTDNASLDTFQAHYAQTSSYMEAAGDALSGAGSVYRQYKNPSSTGM